MEDDCFLEAAYELRFDGMFSEPEDFDDDYLPFDYVESGDEES